MRPGPGWPIRHDLWRDGLAWALTLAPAAAALASLRTDDATGEGAWTGAALTLPLLAALS